MEDVGQAVTVRDLRPADLERVIALDARLVGRRRELYFRQELDKSLAGGGVRISLAAELDGLFVGFLLARLHYGEFGRLEPAAVLETLGVHPDFRGQGVGPALMEQLCTNLRGLSVATLQTSVDWNDQHLIAFFHRRGFRPAPRLSLDLDLDLRPA